LAAPVENPEFVIIAEQNFYSLRVPGRADVKYVGGRRHNVDIVDLPNSSSREICSSGIKDRFHLREPRIIQMLGEKR
jgi:hypothetical protein